MPQEFELTLTYTYKVLHSHHMDKSIHYSYMPVHGWYSLSFKREHIETWIFPRKGWGHYPHHLFRVCFVLCFIALITKWHILHLSVNRRVAASPYHAEWEYRESKDLVLVTAECPASGTVSGHLACNRDPIFAEWIPVNAFVRKASPSAGHRLDVSKTGWCSI